MCSASAQSPVASDLPDSPRPQTNAQTTGDVEGAGPSSHAGSTIAGTVLDTDGDVIQGARVQLSKAGAAQSFREMTSDSTGQFEFAGLEPDTYIVTVSGVGMTRFVSNPITLGANEPVIVPKIVIGVAAVTTTVTAMGPEEASIEQVVIAEQQRVLKVIPNFYSSFDRNAPPMLTTQKYRLAARSLVDPVSFFSIATIAGAEQYQNIFPSFGGGIGGYGKRYGAVYASQASSELLTRAVLPSVFHTDPRYFVMGEGSTGDRAMHAITSTFMTRGDNGSRKINFPEILGDLSSAALSNAYFPAQERGVNLVLVNGFGNLGGNMMANLLREFVLNRLTTRAGR